MELHKIRLVFLIRDTAQSCEKKNYIFIVSFAALRIYGMAVNIKYCANQSLLRNK